mmetsp:Transcript_6437/g.11196  ORF Transcript_6437/g.11196 Transcript_6437/m.11196 type:complete len:596 (+) Transcript_6437:91-1878(+)
MKISPACTKVVALLSVLGGNSVNAFSPSKTSTIHISRSSALASTTVEPTAAATEDVVTSKPLEQKSTVAAIPKFAQRWRKRTKQLATLGPASDTFEMIETLFLAGADIFRLNFSHGSQEQKLDLLRMIREVEEKYSHPIAVLGDLQGPKLRVGEFSNPNGEALEQGQLFRLDLDEALGDSTRVMLPHPEIIAASEIDHVLLVDDGKVKLTVVGKGDKDQHLDCRVDVPGKISNRKGVNTPDSVLDISPLTPKDRSDLEYMVGIGVDWIALSFVQQPSDIDEIQALITQHLPEGAFRPAVMAKIEKPSCFVGDNLENIVDKCDGIMVARGDLGVECAPEDVPLLQKQIIDECRKRAKPVVVATQMLESMIESPTPTRAEASDVATAIYDGADAIMLSAESAAGKFPEESVAMQQRIINRVEGDTHYRSYLDQLSMTKKSTPADAITTAARQIAQTTNAKAIVCFTLQGSTVLRVSQERPTVPILGITPFKETARQLAMSWGVYPNLPRSGSFGFTSDDEDFFNYENPATDGETDDDFDVVLKNACRAALRKGLVNDPNDLLVVTAGLPFGTPGAANVIRVLPAAGPQCWDGICRVD